MRIGYFTSSFPYMNPLTGEKVRPSKDGGVENVAYNLAIEMLKKGHEIYIFTSSIDSNRTIEDYGKIKIYRYRKSFCIGHAPMSIQALYGPLLSNVKLDIIHAHLGNLPLPLTGYMFSKLMKKPFVITHHGDWVGGYGSVIRRISVFVFNKFLCSMLLSGADSIIALSEGHIDDSKYLTKHNGKLVIIPNGINLEDFKVCLSKEECRKKLNLPIDKKIILFVGSLTPRKGPHVLLEAMKKIHDEEEKSYLVFVGSGNMKDQLQQISIKLKIMDEVKFADFVDDYSKKLYMIAADLFVLPSFLEAFPITLLEASASGLPLIGSELNCFKEVIKENYNGMIVKTGDHNDLASKIIHLLKNEELRRNMGINSKIKVNEFTLEKTVDKTEKLYLKMIFENI